jgi:hypothetical protein
MYVLAAQSTNENGFRLAMSLPDPGKEEPSEVGRE